MTPLLRVLSDHAQYHAQSTLTLHELIRNVPRPSPLPQSDSQQSIDFTSSDLLVSLSGSPIPQLGATSDANGMNDDLSLHSDAQPDAHLVSPAIMQQGPFPFDHAPQFSPTGESGLAQAFAAFDAATKRLIAPNQVPSVGFFMAPMPMALNGQHAQMLPWMANGQPLEGIPASQPPIPVQPVGTINPSLLGGMKPALPSRLLPQRVAPPIVQLIERSHIVNTSL